MIFVGLDCGGSSSRVIAVNERSEILFQGQAGSANLSSTPERMIATNLKKATDGCPSADYVCGCFAGLLTSQDHERACIHLKHIFPKAVIRAEPDCMAALYANSPIPDVCVIAGTGSLVCSIIDEKLVRSGGGGFILGDDGSGCMYGRDALRHFLFSREEASPQLLHAVEETYGTLDPSVIMARIYHSNSPAAVISKLAKVVASEARSGHAYALDSVNTNTRNLAKLVLKHIRTYIDPASWKEQVAVVCSGGLWKTDSLFRDKFHSHMGELGEGIALEITMIQMPPVRGALKLALDMQNGN